jgi:hypothetical protein
MLGIRLALKLANETANRWIMHSLCVRSMSEVIELLLREGTVADLENLHLTHDAESGSDGENTAHPPQLHHATAAPIAIPDLR